jgi:hypothetical protein
MANNGPYDAVGIVISGTGCCLTRACCCQDAPVAGVPYVAGLDCPSGQALRACEGVRACSRSASR